MYPIKSLDEFFVAGGDSSKYDAYLTSAERASILTIFHPNYKVVNPLPYHIKNPLVFPLAKSDVWKNYIDNWIEFRTNDGTINRAYEQWILGHEYKRKERAWSVWDDIILPAIEDNFSKHKSKE